LESKRDSASGSNYSEPLAESVIPSTLAAAVVFAAAAYLHNIPCIPAVFTTVIIVAGHTAIAAGMLALSVFISHACNLSSRGERNSGASIIFDAGANGQDNVKR
jgi:hypothetical protein